MTAPVVPGATRERLSEALGAIRGMSGQHGVDHSFDGTCPLCRSDIPGIVDALLAADVFREPEPPVDARGLMAAAVFSASAAQRVLAANARSNSGRAEHTDFADWLEQFGQSLMDPPR